MSDDPILAALARLEAALASTDARLEANDARLEAGMARLEAKLASTDARLEATDARLARLEANDARLEAGMARLEAEQTRMREQFGNKLDDILDKLRAVREDTDNTRAQVLYGLESTLTLNQRITKLEDQMRRAGL